MTKPKKKGQRLATAYWSLVGVGTAVMVSLQPVFADTIWNRFSTIMKDFYGQLMVSRNQRSVDEATSWLKRIVITWIVLNSLGFIVTYLQPLIAGGNYTGT